MFDELHRQRCTEADFSERTGINPSTLRGWRTRCNPRVNDINFALNISYFAQEQLIRLFE